MWTVDGINARIAGTDIFTDAEFPGPQVQIDLRSTQGLDTVGALLINKNIKALEQSGQSVQLVCDDTGMHQLMSAVANHNDELGPPPRPDTTGLLHLVGEQTSQQAGQYYGLISFVGETAVSLLRVVIHPGRIRFAQTIKEIEVGGVHALPIVGLLSFLLGIVIAYQGGVVLKDYGAVLYMADIVGLSMVRELAPLITAIIVAGRTGSAYAAQIGTMKVTQEIDAMRSIGISPMEMLVLPKVLALVISLPLLTLFADLMGIAGGVFMSNAMLGLSPATFIDRLSEALTLKSYLIGICKAPVFALIISLVGCFQGFFSAGSAVAVGRHTTISVVQSIFLVLVVDAAFSIAFSRVGI